MMQIVPLEQVEVGERKRKSIAPGPLNELKEGILSVGNLHPPVCWFNETSQKWILSVGERRFRAIQALAKEGKAYYANNQKIEPGFVGILSLSEFLSEAGRVEAEIMENVQRVDFTWQERSEALADLHALRVKQDPEHQTIRKTGEELVKQRAFTSPSAAAKTISEALVITRHLSDPKIQKARNASEALSLIYKGEQEKIDAEIARRVLARKSEKPLLQLRHGDLLSLLPAMEAGTVDLILADPPYGIGAGGGGFRSRTVHHHNYEDTADNARELAKAILIEGFRVCKNRANLILFFDIRLFDWLRSTASNAGWTVFPRPMIFGKSDSEGLAPWGSQGPRITTEYMLYATKGQRGMHSSPTDYLRFNRKPRHERLHAAEKPVDLLSELIKCCTLPGDVVLDPCCGSGSTLVACKETRRQGIGIEKDKEYFDTAFANVFSEEVEEEVGVKTE